MKKTILTLAVFTVVTSTLFVACNTPTEKVENAAVNVTSAKNDLTTAKEEYTEEVIKFRKETDEKIEANNKSIAEFNARIESQKKDAKADYKKQIAVLEQKNTDMKKKMDDYKAEGKEGWESFKAEFNHDMIELGKAFNDLTIKNSK